jgi:hypothetical protein
VHRCPRYYESLSLLKLAGSTPIESEEDEKLLHHWSQSDLWPAIKEQASSISGSSAQPQIFRNYCPEVAFDRFGIFAHFFAQYADEIDAAAAHRHLDQQGSPPEDFQWNWAMVSPMHYADCPLYSPLSHTATKKDPIIVSQSKEDRILNLKPGLFGVSLNLHPLFKLISDWWKRHSARGG